MIKTKKNCKVCQTILDQPKKWEGRLAKRIYGSRYYMPSSTYNLADIAREYADKFGYESLLNHAKKHQALSEVDFNNRQLRQVTNEAEKKLIQRAIKSTDVWDEVITKGMKDLKSGAISLNANHLLGAARDKSNFELKHADQQLALMDMVFGFASGEELPDGVREDTDGLIEGEIIAPGTEASDSEREERSRSFYQSLAGDAPTPRTD
jgi:hypothetical protein